MTRTTDPGFESAGGIPRPGPVESGATTRGGRRGRRARRLTRSAAVALVAALLAVVPALAGPLAPRADAASPATPGTWTITPQDGAWLVELRLDDPLPVRAAQPTLLIVTPDASGTGTVTTDLGLAVADPSDPTLVRAVTEDEVAGSPAVSSVVLGWDGTATAEAGDGGPTTLPAPPPGPPLTQDPLAAGSHPVGTAFYNLGDEAVDLADIPGRKGEMRGVVYYPADLATPAPLVVFLHGRHVACVDGAMRWPCSASGDVPSYLGYQQMGQLLASQGFAVVSISANAVNALDGGRLDNGDEARADLVLQTLDRLQAATTGGSPGFPGLLQGRLDLGRVGLMGHSRGGEAVVRAAQLNALRAQPYGIKGVFPLAPTDVARLTLPGVPLATLLPYCDGDVSDLSGQAYVDDSRHAFGSTDSVLRASLLMLGANHNYFNTVWSPGGFPTGTMDDWSMVDRDQSNPVCGATAPGRLSQDEQRQAGAGYLAAFFALTLHGDTALQPMFDGSAPPTPSLGGADVRVLSQAPSGGRTDIARFDTTPASVVRTTGNVTATVCAGHQLARQEPLPVCSFDRGPQVPHWSSKGFTPTDATTPMLHVQWDGAGTLTVPVPASASVLDGQQALSIWLGASDDGLPPADVGIEIVGTDGTTPVSTERVLPATSPLPGEYPLGKLMVRQIRVPVSELAGVGQLQAIRLTAGSSSGSLYLSDISLVEAEPGAPGIAPYPALRMVPTSTRIDRLHAGQARVAVLLDRVGTAPVTGRWAVTGPGATDVDTDLALTIPAGTRCLALPLPADDVPAAAPVGSSQQDREVVVAALTGSRPATLTAGVRVQDAPTDGLDVGEQGDPCAEATAAPGLAAISPASAAAGAQITVTGQGFRVGETVLFSLGSGPTGARAVADAGGRVSATLTVPGTAATGALPVTLTGYGSNRVSTGGLQVVPGPVTPTSTTTTPPSTTPTSTTPTSTTPTSTTPTSTTTATSTTPTSTSGTPTSTTTSSPTSDDPLTSLPDPFTSDPFVPVDPVTFPADPVTLGQFTVPVVDPGYSDPVYAAAPAYTTPATTSTYSSLAQTGFRVAAVVVPALLLLAGGATLLLVGRRSGAHGPGRRR